MSSSSQPILRYLLLSSLSGPLVCVMVIRTYLIFLRSKFVTLVDLCISPSTKSLKVNLEKKVDPVYQVEKWGKIHSEVMESEVLPMLLSAK